jgi:hypothetical protein
MEVTVIGIEAGGSAGFSFGSFCLGPEAGGGRNFPI